MSKIRRYVTQGRSGPDSRPGHRRTEEQSRGEGEINIKKRTKQKDSTDEGRSYKMEVDEKKDEAERKRKQ